MTDRAQRFRDLTLEGKTWEEARAITEEEFDPLIEKILYPKGRKEKKKIKMHPQDDGTFASEWSPYMKIYDSIRPTIQGKALYIRLLVQTQFYFRFIADALSIYAEIKPNYKLYPQGIEITEGLANYLTEVAEDNDFEYCGRAE